MENRPGNTFSMDRRIGSTTYKLTVHFSEDETDGFEDKIMRMIQREAMDTSAACGIMDVPLMSRQSERSA